MEKDFQSDIQAIQKIDAVSSILEVVCLTTGMGFAAVARVTEDRWVACAVKDDIAFGLKPGGELKVETTICNEIRQSGNAVVIDHVAQDALFCKHPTPGMYGFQSYISMPIVRSDGSFFGTLCAIDPRPVVLNTPHPLALRNASWADPRRQGWAGRHALGFQMPMLPERSLRADGAARVERILRAWAGPDWAATAEFDEVVRRNRDAMLIPGVAHCALEYFRWAVRSQARPDGQRFAAELARPVEVPVLQLHGTRDPAMLERTARASARWVAAERYQYRALPAVGHFPHQEAAAATTALIADFLAG